MFKCAPEKGDVESELKSVVDYVIDTSPDQAAMAERFYLLGGRLGEYMADAMRNFLPNLGSIFPPRSLRRVLPSLDLPYTRGRSNLLDVLLPNSPFMLNKSRDDDIIRRLDNRMPILDESPRYIMHAYYELYRRKRRDGDLEKKPASYAATVHSLAYNRAS